MKLERPTPDEIAATIPQPDLDAVLGKGEAVITEAARELATKMLAHGYTATETRNATNRYFEQFEGLISETKHLKEKTLAEQVRFQQEGK